MDSPYPERCVLLAPLSGYTDAAFRRACRLWGCTYAFTPLVAARSVLHASPRAPVLLKRTDEEAWLGVQLLGESPAVFGEAAEALRDWPFDVIDLNMGCPVRKVTKNGSGAALSQLPQVAGRCVAAAVARSRVPVTAKIRVVSRTDPTPTLELARALEDAGARALTVHGREWSDVYSGPVAVEVIRAVREAVGIPVIANGGVVDAASAEALRAATGCSRIMVARGAIGNPWIFGALLEPDTYSPPTHEEVCGMMEAHVRGMLGLYGERIGMRNARKVILAYMKGRGFHSERRRSVSFLSTLDDFLRFVTDLRAEGPSARYNPEQASRVTAVASPGSGGTA